MRVQSAVTQWQKTTILIFASHIFHEIRLPHRLRSFHLLLDHENLGISYHSHNITFVKASQWLFRGWKYVLDRENSTPDFLLCFIFSCRVFSSLWSMSVWQQTLCMWESVLCWLKELILDSSTYISKIESYKFKIGKSPDRYIYRQPEAGRNNLIVLEEL